MMKIDVIRKACLEMIEAWENNQAQWSECAQKNTQILRAEGITDNMEMGKPESEYWANNDLMVLFLAGQLVAVVDLCSGDKAYMVPSIMDAAAAHFPR